MMVNANNGSYHVTCPVCGGGEVVVMAQVKEANSFVFHIGLSYADGSHRSYSAKASDYGHRLGTESIRGLFERLLARVEQDGFRILNITGHRQSGARATPGRNGQPISLPIR